MQAEQGAEAKRQEEQPDDASSYDTLTIKSETEYAMVATEVNCNGRAPDPIIYGKAVASALAMKNVDIALGLDFETLVADYN